MCISSIELVWVENMENGRKTTIFGHFQGVVPVPNRVVPVP